MIRSILFLITFDTIPRLENQSMCIYASNILHFHKCLNYNLESFATSFRYGIYGNHNDEVETNSTVAGSIKGVRFIHDILSNL